MENNSSFFDMKINLINITVIDSLQNQSLKQQKMLFVLLIIAKLVIYSTYSCKHSSSNCL